MRNLCLLLLGITGVVFSTLAQQPFSKNYQTSEGLPSNYNYFVFQDSKGYIWISSDVGVSRFDGQNFTIYNTSHGLPDNEVFSMCEDRAGRIWFATLNGKAGFFYNGALYNGNNTPFLKKCDLKGMVIKLMELENGQISYSGMFKTLVIDFDHQWVEERKTENGVIVVWQNPGNLIGGLARQFGFIQSDGFKKLNEVPPFAQSINGIGSGDSLVISSGRKLCYLNRYTGTVYGSVTNLPEGNQYIFLKKIGNHLWAGTRSGAYQFDYQTLRVEKYYLAGRSVSSVMEDREGGLWFTTFEEGTFYVPDPDIVQYSIADGLVHKRVICLSRDAHRQLWIGSEGSAYSIFDGKTIQSRVIFRKNVINKNISNIRHLPDGRTLIIGKAGTLIIQKDKKELLIQRATDVQIDHNGDYWAGLNGLYQIPKLLASRKSITVSQPVDIPDETPLYGLPGVFRYKGEKVEKIEFDEQYRLWAGSRNGLYAIESDGTERKILPHSIKDMHFDPVRQHLWVLSESRGLFLFRQGELTDSLLIGNQFGEVICRDLCLDDVGQLWIGTASGLFRVHFSGEHLQLTNFWGVLGLGWDKINAVEVMGDQVFIGKDDGLLAIPQSILLLSPPSPPALIKSVRINNQVYLTDPVHPLMMDYGQGSLSIEFEGLSYREPQYLRYRYRMTGLDTLWRETANEALEFASLRPGKYSFEVQTVNGAGEINAVTARVAIKVNPPVWMRGWFYLLLTALIGALLFVYIKWRENRLRTGYELERKLVENSRQTAELQRKNADLKMLALRLQMNPHFIFNALNTIKGYYGQEKLVEANAFISKFARLLRLNLDYSDTMIPLDQEIELLRIYLQLSQIRYPDKIHFEIVVAPEINPMDTLVPSMLLQPFVENAVIHGLAPKKTPGNIFIHFALEKTEIVASVRDTGVGRAAAAQVVFRDPHKPLATQITIERLQLLRSSTHDTPALHIRDLYDNGQPIGTEVVLHIPFQFHDQRHHH